MSITYSELRHHFVDPRLAFYMRHCSGNSFHSQI
nr:MAG TPA: hypothetical protein [Caudoviricetes sp.]